MIAKDTIATYAQYNEDVTLAALLSEVKDGFYVDIGANHEQFHSVTKYFYDQGWHGINVEPIPRLIKEIEAKRPRDVNLNYAVSDKKGKLAFREYPDHDGFSTFSEASKRENEKRGLPYVDYEIKVDSLKNIFAKYKVEVIDFLKIDVEGLEEAVIKGNDWKKYRPKVICIEANHRDTDWSEFLISQGYAKAIFDGLNEYYVANENRDLFEGYMFAERAAILSHNALRKHHFDAWKADLTHMDELRGVMRKQDDVIKSLAAYQEEAQRNTTSLKYLWKQLVRQALRRLTNR